MAARKKTTRTTNSRKKNNSNQIITTFKEELITWIVLALSILLFLCNFHICGGLGNAISDVMFGLFGLLAYAIPILVFIGFIFKLANKDLGVATIKLIAAIVLISLLGILVDLILGGARKLDSYDVKAIYEAGIMRKGCGFVFGSLSYLIHHLIGTAGTVLLSIVLAAICIVVITERSLFQTGRSLVHNVQESAWDNTEKRRERTRARRIEDDERHRARLEKKRLDDEKWQEEELRRQQEEDEKILRMDKKASGVDLSAVGAINPIKENKTDMVVEAMHEINALDFEDESMYENVRIHAKRSDEFLSGPGVTAQESEIIEEYDSLEEEAFSTEDSYDALSEDVSYGDDMHELSIEDNDNIYKQENDGQMTFVETAEAVETRKKPKARLNNGSATFSDLDNYKPPVKKQKPYKLPPINLLKGSSGDNGKSNASELEHTSAILEETLKNFGVEAKVIGASRGPSVTRYEIQPKAGVKVSRIVNLQDDIKLNLAATDIRIEAPIPGKSAVGIEVPNESSEMVSLRELIDSPEFKAERDDKSKLTFAVGKDIGGKTILTNIGKMPHGLIAGATGSGKSVCINTMILSLLYKFSPEELKLIMVDPKVVELSVYNGIPHLMVPVVTDPKKAAAALSWAVSEMTDRYKKFAEMSVRDLAGYNRKVEGLTDEVDIAVYKKLPYIVIIVDEMADLMMVAAKEVEDSISRLAALARACGIHLILATQRPSVDVITGVIKANMPSRVAFAVSSLVDSRTILDMAGAEKLLGKGDMLFFPQGFPKPVRLQGAFVSDSEVEDVVNFIKVQQFKPEGQEEIEEKINSISVSTGSSGGSNGIDDTEDAFDDLFERAGRYIIEKDRATVGNLQRNFKIGFNRAARIMDQLCEAGVVGEGEGTKPRKVLMSMSEFDNYIEEYL